MAHVCRRFKNNVECPIAFASRILSPAERNYSVTEKEALACLWAAEKFHFYLYGRKFTLRTDHQALRTLLSAQGAGRRPLRLHRWCDRLFAYSFDIEYVHGDTNYIADMLSRAAIAETNSVSYDVNSILGTPGTSLISLSDLSRASQADSQFRDIAKFIREGWPVSRKFVPAEISEYYNIREELTCFGNECIARGERAIIPESLRSHVLQLAHEGHPGMVKTKQRCRDAVWWPGIDRDAERYVRNVIADCQRDYLRQRTAVHVRCFRSVYEGKLYKTGTRPDLRL